MSKPVVSMLYACTRDGLIHPLRVGENGRLTPLPSEPVRVVPPCTDPETQPSSEILMIVHPNRQFAYAINRDNRLAMGMQVTLRVYTITPEGVLKLLQKLPPIADLADHILLDRKQRFLYLSGAKHLWIYPLQSDGKLRNPKVAMPFSNISIPQEWEPRMHSHDWTVQYSSVFFFPNGREVFVYRYLAWQSDHQWGYYLYRIGAEGIWQPVDPADFGEGGKYRHDGGPLIPLPHSPFVYQNCDIRGDSVRGFRIDGERIYALPSSAIPARLMQIIAVDPLGRFVFGRMTDVKSPRTIDTFRVDGKGKLSLVYTFQPKNYLEFWPNIDATGRYLYSDLTYHILSDGRLEPSEGRPTFPKDTSSIVTVGLP